MKKPSCAVCSTSFFNKTWSELVTKIGEDRVYWHIYNYGSSRWQTEFNRVSACFKTAYSTKQNHTDLLITNAPQEAFWGAVFATLIGVKAKHVTCAFNFAELPDGVKRRLMTWACTKISKFVVYSKLEKQVYSDYWHIPLERIEVMRLSFSPPEAQPEEPMEVGDYICAIGGQARDYQMLMATIEKLPEIPLILVVRPNNLKGLNIPSHVKVMVDIPPTQAMNILKYSRFMVLPLKDAQARSGHITLLWAMYLSKASIVTNASGVSDYAIHDYNAISCEPSVPDALAEAIRVLWNAPAKCQQLGENGRKFAEEYCSEEAAQQYLQDLFSEVC